MEFANKPQWLILMQLPTSGLDASQKSYKVNIELKSLVDRLIVLILDWFEKLHYIIITFNVC